jgi:hypothetical protein
MSRETRHMLVRLTMLCVPFLTVSSALSAQESSPTQTAKVPSKQLCSIAGVVVKSGTNDPLKKAGISLQKANDPSSGYSTQTGAWGTSQSRTSSPATTAHQPLRHLHDVRFWASKKRR